jgi:hypothetical protein
MDLAYDKKKASALADANILKKVAIVSQKNLTISEM